MGENLRVSFRGIWSHKLRSFLTMLGVIIGIASIIAIVSTIKGTNDQIMQNLIGAGNNNVNVVLRQGEYEYPMDMGVPQGIAPITEEQMEKIRALPDVADASFYNSRTYADGITSGKNTLGGGTIRGVDLHYMNTCGYVVYRGRFFTQADYDRIRKVALLDEAASQTLFPGEDAVGGTIELRGEPFTVVGVYRRAETFKPVINSLQDYQTYNQESYGQVLVPDAAWPIAYTFDEPKNCVARAVDVKEMSSVGKEVEEILADCVLSQDSELSYKAEDLLEKARNKQELSRSTNNLLIWVASIALLVGGIGVMNIMLVSVTERTSEIGLKKALGARKRRILAQFLTESALLTSIGGVLGVAAGIVLAFVIARVSEIPPSISVPAIILGVGFSMLIGIVCGLLPSIKAANLNPIDALRRE